jgi:DMSO/TMAO reductase YedYZ heme-binding membrane subunit
MSPEVDPQIWWYVARSAGIVSWGMLTASVLWGVVLATDLFPASRRPSWLVATHRWLGSLALWFLAIHLAALVADSYVAFDPIDLVVPFASSWKPLPVAAGVLALWASVAVEATSLLIRRANRRLWHLVHLSGYAAFWLASLHGTFAGTDAANPVYVATSIAVSAAVMAATVFRVLRRLPGAARPRRPSPRSPRPGTGAADPVGVSAPLR